MTFAGSKNILLNSLAALATAGVLYGAYAYYEKSVPPVPCTTVLTYSVGDLDTRFDISRADFAKAIQDAAQVWNTAYGRTLIMESSTSTLPVSLVYDTRQETVELGTAITKEQEAYNAQKSLVDARRSSLDKAQQAYTKARDTFEVDTTAYSERVKKANARGGASPSEFNDFEQERKKLEAEQESLNRSADALNDQVLDVNEQIKELNVLAKKTNQKVAVYNEGANEDFDQGLYVRDNEGTRITIYEFKNRGELTRVLAHELGHALGLEHNDNPASIMYAYNSGSSLALSLDDLSALNTLCSVGK